jgi:hypothetical protein
MKVRFHSRLDGIALHLIWGLKSINKLNKKWTETALGTSSRSEDERDRMISNIILNLLLHEMIEQVPIEGRAR